MHPHITKLCNLAAKPKRHIIGLMSGTSVDGLDVALCAISGNGVETEVKIENFETAPYDDNFKQQVKSVFSKRQVDLEKLCLLNPWIALQHATIVNNCLKKWKISPAEIDLLSSHGQTIYHAPKALHEQPGFGNATLQIGDGDHLAVATGIITISDFRQKHIAAGGEGAPLAVYGDYLIFSKKGENRVMLNMGGIANFTFLPADGEVNSVFSTDTGTGNTLMDAYMQQHFPGTYFDKNGQVAASGKVNDKLLAALKDHPFFEQPFPKTTGPELFNLGYLEAAMNKSLAKGLSHGDVMATLNRFTSLTITDALRKCFGEQDSFILYASGGGMHNPLLMQAIQEDLPTCSVRTTDALQIHPDAKEAVLFAVLANECVCGSGSTIGNPARGIPSVTMGKISFPE